MARSPDSQEQELLDDLIVNSYTFATASDLRASLLAAADDRESKLKALQMLSAAEKLTLLEKLTPHNYEDWCESIRTHISFTDSSAAFLSSAQPTATIEIWQRYWSTTLRPLAPSGVSVPIGAKPWDLLAKFTSSIRQKTASSKIRAATALFGIKPQRSLAALWSELDRQMTMYNALFPGRLRSDGHVAETLHFIVCGCIEQHHPDLALRCVNTGSLDETLLLLQEHSERPKLHQAALPTRQTPASRPRQSRPTCTHCKKPGHTEDKCWGKAKGTQVDTGASVKAVHAPGESAQFQLDSAAEQHVAFNETLFSSYTKCQSTVTLANGTPATVLGRGTLTIPSNPPILAHALHLQGSGPTLLSLARLQDDGYWLKSSYNSPLQLCDASHQIRLTFERRGNQFLLAALPSPAADWHAALGHINPRAVSNTLRQQHITATSPSPSTKECNACAAAKFTTRPGKGKLIHEASKFLDVIHVDVVGGKDALPPSTHVGDEPAATMALIMIDEFTRYKWALPLYAKSDAPIRLKEILLQCHRQHGQLPFRIHSDRGSEFVGAKLSDWISESGIRWTGSAAHAHEQNGLVERTNRTIFEALRAAHLHGNLPAKHWATTLTATVETLNKTSNTSGTKSPFEMVHGTTPTLYMEPIGCRVIFRKDENAPLPKLASRTTDGVFLGRINGIPHILDTKTKRIVTRRDITVFPSEFPLRPRISAVSESGTVPVAVALSSADREHWYAAMHKEVDQMMAMKVWNLVPKDTLPPGTKVMSGTWVLRTKSSGEKKARWCARGFSEPDVDTVYADVLQAVAMRLFFAYAAQQRFTVRHVDVTSAFLNAELDKPIYLMQPRHLRPIPGMVCQLNKAIYGLRTAPRRWQETLASALTSKGYKQLQHDKNLFRKGSLLMSVYVDDFKITGPPQDIDSAVADLQSLYRVRDLGNVTNYLGMEIDSSEGYKLTQVVKIDNLVQMLGLQNARPATIPIPDDNKIDSNTEDVLTGPQTTLYRTAVGQLLHISLLTRPDIAYAVMRLTQRFARPTDNCYHALLSVARYLKGTRQKGLHFKPADGVILGSTDSSWSTATQARATTGNIFLLNGAPIAWRAKRQSLTAQSTCEAEYVAAATAATQCRWLLPLFNEMWQADHGPIILQMDNQAAIATAKSSGLAPRNRHFLIREAVLREALADKIVDIRYTPSEQVIADGMTKGLQRVKHEAFSSLLRM